MCICGVSAICDSFASHTWKKIIEREREKIGWRDATRVRFLFEHARMSLLFYTSNLNVSTHTRMMVIICVYTIFITSQIEWLKKQIDEDVLHFVRIKSLRWFPFYWSLSSLLLNISALYTCLIMTLIRVDSTICMTSGKRIDYTPHCVP
jgi:hypothetical protein